MQPDAVEVELVDFGVLASWMSASGLPDGPFSDVSVLAGGTQNVLVRFTRGGRTFVLRRPPRHLRKRSNDVLRREMQVLSALKGTDVPHPGFIAGCPDESVMGGAVFYLMEPVDGFNPTVSLPESHESVRREMGFSAVDALARLGAVDHVAVGLGSVGNPDGFLDRQVGRWLDDLASYDAFEGYPGHSLPNVSSVASWLSDHVPAAWTPGIIHGDYHMANLMFRFDGPEVAAIVDWEMCTIGDPLLDLGWLIATGDSWVGMPAAGEVIDHYAGRTTRDLTHMQWYAVTACFKLGIVLEGTNARAHAGKAPKDIGDLLHATAVHLLTRADDLISTW